MLHAEESLVGLVKTSWTNTDANNGINPPELSVAEADALVAEAEAIMNAPELAAA